MLLQNLKIKMMATTFIVSMVPATLFASVVQVDNAGLSPSESKAANQFLVETYEMLPSLMRKDLDQKSFVIQFKKLPAMRYGNSHPEQRLIALNREFLRILSDQKIAAMTPEKWAMAYLVGSQKNLIDPKDPPLWPPHASALQLFRATFIHELTHFYDLEIIPAKGQTPISSRPEFLNIAGFPERGFLYPSREPVNHLKTGSPDPYEWQNPKEAMAVNMEYFILDDSFHCRRPSIDLYFRNQFNLPKFNLSPCQSKQEVLLSYTEQHLPSQRWEKWNLNKLYQVHYLYAGSGEEGSSKFGHAMLRFVFCNPSREKVGPECMDDLFSHRVVSFRAAVNQPSLDIIKGLTGDYPSLLFILPFADVHRDYTYREMRELFSLPLNLTQLEKRRLFDRVIEMHWSYQGAYRFLSDNCAHETMNTLQSALIERSSLTNDYVIRPDSLYGDLIDLKIATGFHLDQDRKLFPKGQYYPSQRKIFEETLSALIEKGIIPNNMNLDNFLSSSTSIRLNFINKIAAVRDSEMRSRLILGFLNLQQLIFDRLMKEIGEKQFATYAENMSKQAQTPAGKDIQNLTKFMFESSIPWLMRPFEREYGIPQFASITDKQLKEQDEIFLKKMKMSQNAWKSFLVQLPRTSKSQLDTEQAFLDRLYFILNHTK